jgi:hypothetical protein
MRVATKIAIPSVWFWAAKNNSRQSKQFWILFGGLLVQKRMICFQRRLTLCVGAMGLRLTHLFETSTTVLKSVCSASDTHTRAFLVIVSQQRGQLCGGLRFGALQVGRPHGLLALSQGLMSDVNVSNTSITGWE